MFLSHANNSWHFKVSKVNKIVFERQTANMMAMETWIKLHLWFIGRWATYALMEDGQFLYKWGNLVLVQGEMKVYFLSLAGMRSRYT